jgi:nitrite reductase/ring-hydroxylating ferredoxin subunit
MLSREENDLLTRTGPGTPMGKLLRRYWLPALFASQLPEPDCPPVRVTLLGEPLVAFRDTTGQCALLGAHCPHRGASLFFGRNEECGLRCVYHGWKFDVHGRCVDMPSEPPESSFKDKIHHTAYPCAERGGVIWAYLGPPALRPGLPELEWARVPASHRFMTRHIQDCNWFQAVEGGYDPSHVRFLHRWDDPKIALMPHVAGPTRARSEFVQTDYGFLSGGAREIEPGRWYWSVSQLVLPFHKNVPRFGGDAEPIGAHAWVPIDDERCMTWSVEYHPDRPLTDAELAACQSWSWIHLENLPGSDHTVLNRHNDYAIDRARQRAQGQSYTGIHGTGAQDTAMQESQGPIVDRTQEHLGTSDAAIIKIRRCYLDLLQAVEQGATPPGLDPTSQRCRSATFTTGPDVPFLEAADPHVNPPTAARPLEPIT